jgi:alpha-glucosidase
MAAEWWRGSVIYQVYPRSFQDSNGDGVGDLPGITARLGHVAALGADAVWLSPIFPSPMVDMGYDVSDYTDIDPVFGTLADFDAMIARAHELGLKVIIDQVLNHSSADHPFFVESRSSRDNPKADWYVWADPKPDGDVPNNWQALFGGSAWTWDARRRQYYLHNFHSQQPDFNFWNPEVQDWLLNTMRFWLDRGVDGFRLDTVNFYFHDKELRNNPPHPKARSATRPFDMQDSLFQKTRPENIAFLERLRALLDEYDDRTMVGEVGELVRPIETMAAYTAPGRLHMAYSFDMLGPDFTPAHFRRTVEAFFAAAPGSCPCWAFSNHDVIRHASRWAAFGPQDDLARQAAALLLTLPGSICVYQGEELGQTESDLTRAEITDPQGIAFWPDDKGRDGCRTPMVWDAAQPNGGFTTGTPWLPVKAPQLARAVAGQAGNPESVLGFYRRMLALRREEPDLRGMAVSFADTPAPVLAYTRGDGTFCAFNLSHEATDIALPRVSEVLLHQNVTATGLGPNGVLIARL